MSEKIKILICGVLPPPSFGHSVTYQTLMNSVFTRNFDVCFLNMKFWTYQKHKRVTLIKLVKLIEYYFIFIYKLLTFRPRYVLYNISFDKMPLPKDALMCVTGKLFGAKIILHDHGQYLRELFESSNRFYKFLIRQIFRSSSAAIVFGQKVVGLYEGFMDTRKVFSVPGGVEDTRDILSEDIKNDSQKLSLQVLYFSYLSETKGVYVALEAAEKILRDRKDIQFVFVGPLESTKVETALNHLMKAYPQVKYLGYVDAIRKRAAVFRQSDIFIFPTLRDVFGLVLIHAMAEGLPIIASREGTIPEIMEDNVNGFLINKGDANQLVERILFLSREEALRKKMGKANRTKYEQLYAPDQFGQRMTEAFLKIHMLL